MSTQTPEDRLRKQVEAIYMKRLPNPHTGLFDIKSSIDDIMQAVNAYTTNKIIEARKRTASDIFNLAHKYANNDPTMVGSEELRSYHYYNAIAKIGEFDGR